ncbi:Transcription factor BTF3 4 [Cichlidogyrus casuarinus]|uniref:Transcription factor BTF3 n=1 Tax=Cichlidogyrus casuarinus TaxID=1844966 RepID=A0ABD2QN02_9PLAT
MQVEKENRLDIKEISEEKLKRLEAMKEKVRIGGPGTARRKKKVVHKNPREDDKVLQGTLKKLNLAPITGIEEVNMLKLDSTMVHFKNPKVQMSSQANMFAISGQAETKSLQEFVPQMFSQLESAKQRLEQMKAAKATSEDIPELKQDFDENN